MQGFLVSVHGLVFITSSLARNNLKSTLFACVNADSFKDLFMDLYCKRWFLQKCPCLDGHIQFIFSKRVECFWALCCTMLFTVIRDPHYCKYAVCSTYCRRQDWAIFLLFSLHFCFPPIPGHILECAFPMLQTSVWVLSSVGEHSEVEVHGGAGSALCGTRRACFSDL